MDLQLESGLIIEDATEKDIRENIAGEEFAILCDSDDTYIQCAKQSDSPPLYALEYQHGSTSEHFRATDEAISLSQVIDIFIKYLHGDHTWRTSFSWVSLDL